MAVSTIIKKTCPQCGKIAVEKSRSDMVFFTMLNLECGHSITEDKLVQTRIQLDTDISYRNIGQFKLRQYQIEGIKFAENANCRVLFADEQGLGKTLEATGTLILNREKLLPCAYVTKATLTHQSFHEFGRLTKNGEKKLLVQVLNTGKEKCLPGFDIYVFTYDRLKVEGIFDMIGGPSAIKTVIIDECQAIKNHTSGRAKAVQSLCKETPHIMALSGTPIKNNAGEYFTILNVLQPTRFPTYQGFLDRWCDHYWNGYGEKVGGLANPDLFRDFTKDFIIRRTRKEVAPEIPDVDRQFFHCELNKDLRGAYGAAIDELEELVYQKQDSLGDMAAKIAIMQKLRQITGLSKSVECAEYISEFVEQGVDEDTGVCKKLVVFAHHHAVIAAIENLINPWLKKEGYNPIVNLHAGLDSAGRIAAVNRFKDDDKCPVLLASTLAAGEGLNLQFCSTAVMLERQWNPANEEQAEGRFARLGQSAEKIQITYMIASGTIDEYFTELVEAKRAIVASTLDNKQIPWDENSLLKDLVNVLVTKGKPKWKL